MIKVLNGKFFYRLDTERKPDYFVDLMAFLIARNVNEKELNKLRQLDINSILQNGLKINANLFNLNVKIKDESITLLFETNLDSLEFDNLIEGYFQ